MKDEDTAAMSDGLGLIIVAIALGLAAFAVVYFLFGKTSMILVS